jgi:pilus assembly protein CpaD
LAEESLRRGSGAATVSSGDASFAQTLAARLQRLGVAAKADSAKGGSDEATIAIPVWTARLPECGRFERGMNPDYDNTPNSNWGCSVNRNIAAMVQNPADLVRSREASGRDGNRSADVLDKYGHGAATGSTPEVITAGSASTVGH